jgi:hypothetical protein
MAPNGRLRPVKKKYSQRGILAGNWPLSGCLENGTPPGDFNVADRRVIYFATS